MVLSQDSVIRMHPDEKILNMRKGFKQFLVIM